MAPYTQLNTVFHTQKGRYSNCMQFYAAVAAQCPEPPLLIDILDEWETKIWLRRRKVADSFWKKPAGGLRRRRALKINSFNWGERTDRRVGLVAKERRTNLSSRCRTRRQWQKPEDRCRVFILEEDARDVCGQQWGRPITNWPAGPKLFAFSTVKQAMEAKVNSCGRHKMLMFKKGCNKWHFLIAIDQVKLEGECEEDFLDTNYLFHQTTTRECCIPKEVEFALNLLQ